MRPLALLAGFIFSLVNITHAAPLHDTAVTAIDGKAGTLAAFKGRVLLIVNTASECGFTPQYQGLEALFAKYRAQGLTILGFPCNQFGAQEPGTNSEIKKFCDATYRVTFPLFAKIDVNGANRHPLYAALAGKGSPFPGNVKWNFEKFLVARDGTVLARFPADAEPDSPEVVKAVEGALAAK
jgi:glutathione peroxidase